MAFIIYNIIIGIIGATCLVLGYSWGQMATHKRYKELIQDLKDKCEDFKLERDIFKRNYEASEKIIDKYLDYSKKNVKTAKLKNKKNSHMPPTNVIKT